MARTYQEAMAESHAEAELIAAEWRELYRRKVRGKVREDCLNRWRKAQDKCVAAFNAWVKETA